ncbi:arogenate dehydratase/prephenate dehydratase 6, chloroplastic-like isoform X2 [Camellia sinensis]|uniref:arogenate dehydratase/prephenate dehydratase 6, chloroplastic-like isoform X2 n=1 Tax=Camellia sinensis TaxID=4442 RepID=UPI001036993E|nr:arogenate dehydratase/prephenate dehydratase 6, chloroplastic-like isoform X2 [Camellia sinensis]
MGSSDKGTGVVDCTVGTIVWVRRRNGWWWPGKILGPEELSAAHLMSPRSETPVKLLGREDASVKVRISYKGVPGAYSEAAALKAYSQCENVPCNKFENAFKAVKLWLADKTVLPIENSLGGSIHRNYDLLLWHKLHIVGEVQLAVNLCLLALPGVRTEHLKRVLSHPQTCHSDVCNCSSIWGFKICPSLEEQMLEVISIIFQLRYDYKVTRKQLLQLVASNELRDAGAVASARAAEIYGLDILAERIQVEDIVVLKSIIFLQVILGCLLRVPMVKLLQSIGKIIWNCCTSYMANKVQFPKDGDYLYTGGQQDPYILCWDIRKAVDIVFKLYRSSENTNQRILFDIDPFGQHLGTGSEDGLVQIYNLQMGQWVSSFQAALGSSSGKICKLR